MGEPYSVIKDMQRRRSRGELSEQAYNTFMAELTTLQSIRERVAMLEQIAATLIAQEDQKRAEQADERDAHESDDAPTK